MTSLESQNQLLGPKYSFVSISKKSFKRSIIISVNGELLRKKESLITEVENAAFETTSRTQRKSTWSQATF